MNFKNLQKSLVMASVCEFQKSTKKLLTGGVRHVHHLAAARLAGSNVKCSAELNNNLKNKIFVWAGQLFD